MSKDKKNNEKSKEERINLSEDYEVEYWASEFGVALKTLIQAVKKVGDNAKTVEQFLKQPKI